MAFVSNPSSSEDNQSSSRTDLSIGVGFSYCWLNLEE